ncbi:hypothetical protein KZ483_20970 [Paenibacillus sp. sptzw28]|uniref:hypothetical protein n=1 Tax=Paenibacillus sp. sptzw28 TaxID=715179 RepID=UPI001C6F17B4|nr:hypothetical protein [Paenibacillus sp. sptzw28]QYR20278.1 hypothetical protein KZ483_20970 [Paenibacillus sp. sptzw28]
MEQSLRQRTFQFASDRLQTGDLFFLKGKWTESEFIEIIEQSPWSHIAMVVRLPEFAEPLLWEATPLDDLEDVIMHKRKKGPQLTLLTQRLHAMTSVSEFAFRILDAQRTPEMNAALLQFIKDVHESDFPNDQTLLIEILEGRANVKAPYSNFFCSELVAASYMAMGLLGNDRVPNGFWPVDFAEANQPDFLGQVKLGEQWMLLHSGQRYFMEIAFSPASLPVFG